MNARFPATCDTRAGRTPRVLKTCPEITYAQRAQHLTASLKHSSFARARLNCSVLLHSIFMYSCTYVHKNPAATYVRNVLYIRQTTRRTACRCCTGYYRKTSFDRNVSPVHVHIMGDNMRDFFS